MIVTESVYQLINELCSSLHQAGQFQPIKQSKLKTLKGRMHEIILKTSSTDSSSANPHELYVHELECKLNGCNAAKSSALDACCRLVERDEYFQSEVGQSVMSFLLKLRNTGKCGDQVVHVHALLSSFNLDFHLPIFLRRLNPPCPSIFSTLRSTCKVRTSFYRLICFGLVNTRVEL